MTLAFVDRELWPRAASETISRAMDTTNFETGDTRRPEAEADRRRQIAWEAAMIAEADASIAAGLFVDSAEVDAWIDSIGTDHEFPLPATADRAATCRAR